MKISAANQRKLLYKVDKLTKFGKLTVLNICIAIILIGVCYIILSPVIGIISTAVMHPDDLGNPLVYLIPLTFTLDNIRYAFTHMHFFMTMRNALSFSVGFALMHVFITSFVGYGFARFRFKGSGALFALVLITIVVPVQTYVVPMFMQFRFFVGGANLIGSFWTIALLTLTGVGLRSGLYIYIFRQFFKGLPKEIEEAAFIDGAGPFATYIRVMLPNAIPAIITVFLFAFVWHYNDTFYTGMFVPGNRLIAVSLGSVGGNFSGADDGITRTPPEVQMVVFAAVLLAITPILAIYLFLQRFFMEGLERSGIVG